MQEFIWSENGKYFRAFTDLIGKVIECEEITEAEYNSYKNN